MCMCVQIGLWDVQAASPAVRNVPVFDDGAVMCPLEDAMPLRALIAPLDTFREQMAAAVDQLQPAPARGRLALGSIVNAVLDYLVRPHPCMRTCAILCVLCAMHALPDAHTHTECKSLRVWCRKQQGSARRVKGARSQGGAGAVSYTHLTLPTNREV